MGGFLLFIGLIWLISQLIKEASIKPCAKGTDINRAYIDTVTGKCSAKEMNKRLSNGYYVPKDKK